jgi:uncharacterized protein YjiS (DUF1127 family)
MSRHTDLTQMAQNAFPVTNLPVIPVAPKPADKQSSHGVFGWIASQWTAWFLRRQLNQAKARLAELSDHLLDDAGLPVAQKATALSDQSPTPQTFVGRS